MDGDTTPNEKAMDREGTGRKVGRGDGDGVGVGGGAVSNKV